MMSSIEGLVLTFALNALWQGTLIALAAEILDRAMRRFPARHRHLLWVSALALMLLLPLASLRAQVSAERAERARSEGAAVGREVLCGEKAAGETAPALGAVSCGGRTAGSTGDGVRTLGVTSPLAGPAREARGNARPGALMASYRREIALPGPVRTACAILVFLLFALRFAELGRGWLSARSLRRSAVPRTPEGALEDALARCRRAIHAGEVRLLASAQAPGPLTLGIFRPVVILPERFFDGAPSEQITAALGHELAHVRRRDYALNLLCEILALPLAFHPAVPALKRRIGGTREIACDEMVAAHLLDGPRCARALLGLARSMANAPSPAHALGVLDADILEERIMRLIDTNRRPGARAARLFLTAACSLLVGIGAAASSLSLGIAAAAPAPAPAPTPSGAAARSVDPSMLGTWELFVTRDGQDTETGLARYPFTLTLTTDRGILAGEASIPVVLASDEGPKFKDPVVRPLTAPRFDGRTFAFMIDNGEEYLIGELTHAVPVRTDDVFEGRWTSSLSGQSGGLRMSRKK